VDSKNATVAIVKVSSADTAVERAINLAGGLTGLQPEMSVLIKPNVNSNDPFPATSNPETVAALVRYIKQRYNPRRLIVGDASNWNYLPTIESMTTAGLYQAALRVGAEVIGFEHDEWIRVSPEDATHWNSFSVPKTLLDADFVISQPVLYPHGAPQCLLYASRRAWPRPACRLRIARWHAGHGKRRALPR
jgi:uncharacterized protein (DUF362 family)